MSTPKNVQATVWTCVWDNSNQNRCGIDEFEWEAVGEDERSQTNGMEKDGGEDERRKFKKEVEVCEEGRENEVRILTEEEGWSGEEEGEEEGGDGKVWEEVKKRQMIEERRRLEGEQVGVGARVLKEVREHSVFWRGKWRCACAQVCVSS